MVLSLSQPSPSALALPPLLSPTDPSSSHVEVMKGQYQSLLSQEAKGEGLEELPPLPPSPPAEVVARPPPPPACMPLYRVHQEHLCTREAHLATWPLPPPNSLFVPPDFPPEGVLALLAEHARQAVLQAHRQALMAIHTQVPHYMQGPPPALVAPLNQPPPSLSPPGAPPAGPGGPRARECRFGANCRDLRAPTGCKFLHTQARARPQPFQPEHFQQQQLQQPQQIQQQHFQQFQQQQFQQRQQEATQEQEQEHFQQQRSFQQNKQQSQQKRFQRFIPKKAEVEQTPAEQEPFHIGTFQPEGEMEGGLEDAGGTGRNR